MQTDFSKVTLASQSRLPHFAFARLGLFFGMKTILIRSFYLAVSTFKKSAVLVVQAKADC